ncbi:hypothetical protein D6825_02240 [Candidatus Woesearchaeota archaeon]|nr:MAG: hypothetical protein D6825_02240 [Candidatus Woesearchaeota archaeon]
MPNDSTDEYELLPHKEIEELKEELAKLKEFEIAPSKKLHVSLIEVNKKLDKLITIFEDAAHEMRVEEGGLRFKEKFEPILERMNKILEQNSEIAQGILAIADMLRESRGEEAQMPPGLPPIPEPALRSGNHPPGLQPGPQNTQTQPQQAAGQAPIPPVPEPPIPPAPEPQTTPQQQTGRRSPLPPLPRRRTFGI